MEPQQRRFALHDIRSVVERLALSSPQQIEWVSRQRLRPAEFAHTSTASVCAAIEHFGVEFSPVLLLRLEALVDQLNSMSNQPDALLETPEAILQHSSWTVLRHLAEAALRDRGWPSP